VIQRECWPFVRALVEHQVVDSTSDRAADLLRRGVTELPLVVWSRYQRRGRGRGSNSWWSDGGSLTFTLAIDPAQHHLASEHEPTVALVMAVAAIEALEQLGLSRPHIGIRWPNDVEIAGRKLGGILPEPIETALGHRLLIGVGLNVWSELELAPEDVGRMATSVAAIHGEALAEHTLARLLATILGRFESALLRLVQDNAGLAAEWNRLDRLAGRSVCVDLGTRTVTGVARGIDAQGALRLDDGEAHHRLFGGRVLRRDHETRHG
jgi:BirA family transcriptional regulator, biotin operon repressor / biotin---[acetyl-CoA-carboxylase] ligase